MIELYYKNCILINIEIPNFEEIKKKYFDNEGNKIVLLNDNYSIQSPFKYFTPVMYSDPSGTFGVISSLIIGTIIGAAFGAGIATGKEIYDKGWNPSDWDWRSIGAGVLIGAANGFVTTLGGYAGLASL